MLRVSGYGQTGPYRRRSGFAHIAHAVGGLSYLAGFPGETPVVPGTTPLGDYMSSLYGAIGVMLALRHKEKTGEGQIIDIGIYEAVFRQMDEMAAAYALFGKVREREGSGTVIAVPHGHFRTQDEKWVAIACTTDKMFERLTEAMERPELVLERLYGEQSKRLAARAEVNRIVIEWVGSLTRDQVMERCIDSRGSDRQDQQHRRHLRGRALPGARRARPLHEDGLGDVVVPGVVPKLSETPGRITNLGPPLGNATYEVMRELLDLSAARDRRTAPAARSSDRGSAHERRLQRCPAAFRYPRHRRCHRHRRALLRDDPQRVRRRGAEGRASDRAAMPAGASAPPPAAATR